MRALALARLVRLLVLALACAGPIAVAAPRDSAPLPTDSVYQLEATLVDQEGRATRFRDLRGRPRVVTFIYANCQYVCPLIIEGVKAIERELPSANNRIGFVLITLDPGRDSPAALKRLMSQRRLDAGRWLLLQPSTEDLRGLAGVLGMRYRALADGEFNHTTALVLLDADGRIIARSDRLGAKADPEFLSAIHRASAASTD